MIRHLESRKKLSEFFYKVGRVIALSDNEKGTR